MQIFSGSSNKPLAEKVAKYLNLSLSPLEIRIFPDGERRVRVVEKVLDKDCVVIQSTSAPVDQNYMELFFILDAFKRSGAKSAAAVIPHLGYQRQDHIFRDGEAVSLEVIIETLERVGMDRLITFDLHSVKTPSLFNVPVSHLSALPLFAEKIKEMAEKEGISLSDMVLVSPDMGGIRRIKILSEELSNMPFATIVKDRDLETGKIKDVQLEGEVKEKVALIVDDLISTGETVVKASHLLFEKGAERVFVFATHAVFSKGAVNILDDSKIDRVYVTDSVFISEEKHFKKLEVLSISKLIAEELRKVL